MNDHSPVAYAELPGSHRPLFDHAGAGLSPQPLVGLQNITITIVPRQEGSRGEILRFLSSQPVSARVEHGLIKVQGSARDLSSLFRVNLTGATNARGERFRLRQGPVHVPAGLIPHIRAVLGLDNRPQARPYFHIHNAAPLFTALQVAQIYQFPQGDGAGQYIDYIELGGGYNPADATAAGLDPSLISVVGVDGAQNQYTGNASSADGEVALDYQVGGGIARKSHHRIYFAANTDQGFLDAIAASLNASPAPVAISISWGAPESDWTLQAMQAMDALIAQAVARDIWVLVAAGDGGSNDGTGAPVTDFPACAPHAIGCGGTFLQAAGGTRSSETVWNDPGGGATGGGVSKVFPVPSYQAGLGLPGRGVPDVAGDADPASGFDVVLANQHLTFGGTSAVAPLWAGLTALLRQALGGPLPDPHAFFYAQIGHALFDITQGGNGAFSAKVGYDCCTGCGVPNGQALLAALQGGTTQPAPPPSNPTPPPPAPAPSGCLVTAQQNVVNATNAMLADYKAAKITYDQAATAYGYLIAVYNANKSLPAAEGANAVVIPSFMD